MSEQDGASRDACALAEDVRTGRRSARDVLEDSIERIDRLDGDLNAFVFLDLPAARRRADEIDARVRAGDDPGRLAGVPLGVKELEAVAGWPLTFASTALADRVADHTSTLVARTVAAGAVPIGLTASPEFGRSSFTASTLHGVTRNPWNAALTPGGSSGGSAASVAAGMVPIATGTDGAGSIRIPASFCGLVGFKGTYGRVPQGPGYIPAAERVHLGALTTSVRDTLRFLDAVVGPDPHDPRSLPHPGFSFETAVPSVSLVGRRFAWSPELGFAPCDRRIASLCEDVAHRLVRFVGGTVVAPTVDLPDASRAYRTLSLPEIVRSMRSTRRAVDDLRGLDPVVAHYLRLSESLDVDALVDAYECRSQLVSATAGVFAQTDFLITPTTQTLPFAAAGPVPQEVDGRPLGHLLSIGLTFVFNLTGHPAISVPAGCIDGLPVGLQIVGGYQRDMDVLAAALAVERMQPWSLPDLASVG